jgi:hypothetical protein
MNQELQALILAYEAVSASRDVEAEGALQAFEAKLDLVMNRQPDSPGIFSAQEHHQGASPMGAQAGTKTGGYSAKGIRLTSEARSSEHVVFHHSGSGLWVLRQSIGQHQYRRLSCGFHYVL